MKTKTKKHVLRERKKKQKKNLYYKKIMNHSMDHLYNQSMMYHGRQMHLSLMIISYGKPHYIISNTQTICLTQTSNYTPKKNLRIEKVNLEIPRVLKAYLSNLQYDYFPLEIKICIYVSQEFFIVIKITKKR